MDDKDFVQPGKVNLLTWNRIFRTHSPKHKGEKFYEWDHIF